MCTTCMPDTHGGCQILGNGATVSPCGARNRTQQMFFTTEVSLQKCVFLHEHYEVKFPEKNATPALLNIPHSWLSDWKFVFIESWNIADL